MKPQKATNQLIFVKGTYLSRSAALTPCPQPDAADTHLHFMHALTGKLTLSDTAYAEGIGFFDKVAINYGYRIFTEIDENLPLQRLIDDAEAEGYVFLTDQVRRKGGVWKEL
jgi:Met-zincin